MNPVFIAGDHIITSMGFSSEETASGILENITGFRIISDRNLTPSPVPLSLVNSEMLEERFEKVLLSTYPGKTISGYTRMEKMFILSIHEATKKFGKDIFDEQTLPVFSTTKGNINLLEEAVGKQFDPTRLYLWKMAEVVQHFFGFANKPLIISNACISGVLALSVASRYLKQGRFKRAVVTGGDILSEFVVSGFLSFQALSPEPCKPFDALRNGLSLGEGCGTILLSTDASESSEIRVAGSGTSNDANHISGPSRTGEELSMAVSKALNESGLRTDALDFISAHGTATLYNDEMESKSIGLLGCGNVPVNSFKGYWGHTLGGAGILESVMTLHSMKENILFRSAGYSENGVPGKVNVIREHINKPVNTALKIASGFGGCNAAVIFRKG